MNSRKLDTKKELLLKRRFRVRKKVSGTNERPRLTLKLSNKHIYAQAIDDVKGVTLVALCSTSTKDKMLPNVAGCTKFGELFGSKLSSAGVKTVVFDRNGRRYHGTVKAFADAVRKNGVIF